MNKHNSLDQASDSILRRTREAKGITLEMVHEATKIPLDSLRAIEEGHSVRMISPFYYRGFIKIYSQYLDLDVDDVLKEYKLDTDSVRHPFQEKGEGTKPIDAPKETPKPTVKRALIAKSKLPRLPVDVKKFSNFLTPPRKKLLLQIIAGIIALVVVVKVFGFISTAIKSRPKKPKAVHVQERKAKPADEKKAREIEEAIAAVEAAPVAAPVVQEITSDHAAVSKNRSVSLTVRAQKDSWLQVKSDGDVVFQSTLKRGMAESWGAKEKIELSGKNINQLEFEVNGKVLGSLGPSDRRAKKVVITKDGLSVKK